MGCTLPRWHREREWNLHITTSVTDQRSEITPNLAHVKRPALCYRDIAHLDETTLPTNSEIVVAFTQRPIGFDVKATHESHFAQLSQSLQITTVDLLQNFVAALRLQRPGKLRRGFTPLTSANSSVIVGGSLRINRHMGTDEGHLTDTVLNDLAIRQVQRRGTLHRFTSRATVEAGHRAKRSHDHVQIRVLPKQIHHVGRSIQIFDLRRRQRRITVNNERDNALVSVHVGNLVSDNKITHLTISSTNAVCTRKISRDNDGIFHRPSTCRHERRTHRLRHRRGIHKVRRRHLLTIEGIIAHELSLLGQHKRRTITLIGWNNRPIGVHLGTRNQITSHALVDTTRCHDGIKVPIGFLAEQRHVTTTRENPRIHRRVIGGICAKTLFPCARRTEIRING